MSELQSDAVTLMGIAAEVCKDTLWSVMGVGWWPAKESWEIKLQHDRGDWQVLLVRDGALEQVAALVSDACDGDVPWPEWKHGDPVPQFTCMVPADWAEFEQAEAAGEEPAHPAIINFEVGMNLTVSAIDRNSGAVTLVCDGPWNLPPRAVKPCP